MLKTFWESEQIEAVKGLEDNHLSEMQFRKTVKRDPEGRFIVALSFKGCRPNLGFSKNIAGTRFLSLEKKLEKDPMIYQKYRKVMEEYLNLGHLVEGSLFIFHIGPF